MILRRFPFVWGAPQPAVIPPPVVPPFWVKLVPSALNWNTQKMALNRFVHIYGQAPQAFRAVDFATRIQSEFPFQILTGGDARIASNITAP